MKTIIALLKWLFCPAPQSPTPPAKKPYGCGWQRAHHPELRRRDIDRMQADDDARRGMR
jgi:hypothetical protein